MARVRDQTLLWFHDLDTELPPGTSTSNDMIVIAEYIINVTDENMAPRNPAESDVKVILNSWLLLNMIVRILSFQYIIVNRYFLKRNLGQTHK